MTICHLGFQPKIFNRSDCLGVFTHTTVTFNTLLKPSCVCLALCRPPGALFTTPPHTVASLDTTAAPPDPLAVIVGGNSGLKAALTARQQGDEDDGGGCGAGAVGGDGARDRAQWMTNTTRRPGTGTCRRWRRPPGRTWTHQTRMAWRRRYGPLITATWRRCGSSWLEGGWREKKK